MQKGTEMDEELNLGEMTNNPNYGRPKTGRTVGLNLKITEAENDLLNKCVSETGRSKTDIVVKGIALVYKELQRK